MSTQELSRLGWRLEDHEGETWVEFQGDLDENVDLAPLQAVLEGRVVFHLGKIRRVNSCGVREWVGFISGLHRVTELKLAHCAPQIVWNLNMILNFRGKAQVVSFYAPFRCQSCQAEQTLLLEASTALKVLPTLRCSECGGELELDEFPERYFAFLER